jgi:polyphosphate glucokinase
MKVLGIDIGGSALKGAPVDTVTGRLLAERFRVPTPEKLSPPQMAKAAREISRHFGWRGPVGIGFPGVIHGSRILTSANLHPDFIGCDGGRLFARATACRVAITNDAAAAAQAEIKFGAGKGFAGKTLVLTLGTGIGSAIGYQGVVVPCEFGHLPLKGRDAEKWAAASVKDLEHLSWKKWAHRLRKYLRVIEDALWPERIIIGGGISAEHRKFFKYLDARAPVKAARFLNEAGIVGAALWGEQRLGP